MLKSPSKTLKMRPLGWADAASGMEFMWVEILVAFGRLKLDDEGRVVFPDRTGTPERIEKRPWNPSLRQRWGHVFMSSTVTLTATAEVVRPDPDPESA